MSHITGTTAFSTTNGTPPRFDARREAAQRPWTIGIDEPQTRRMGGSSTPIIHGHSVGLLSRPTRRIERLVCAPAV